MVTCYYPFPGSRTIQFPLALFNLVIGHLKTLLTFLKPRLRMFSYKTDKK